MDNTKAKELIDRYLEGKCTPQEVAIVETWYNKVAANRPEVAAQPDYTARNTQIVAGLPFSLTDPKVLTVKWKKIVAVAAVTVLVTSTWLLWNNKQQQTPATANSYSRDVNPGKNGATLTLANGRKIILSTATNGELVKETGVVISKTANGQLVYQVKERHHKNISGFNTLSTSNAETYQLSLPDGTLVWLNAASSLTYPANFSGSKQRRVKLTGEAYFEVAKKRNQPFVVSMPNQEIKVLGTHFNVNGYSSEPISKTTLLEGSLLVSSLRTGRSKLLKPGQQAQSGPDGLKVAAADAAQAAAWKDGNFVFNGEDLKTVMRQLQRWYDIEVSYQGNLDDIGFVGTISRNNKLSEVFKTLQLTQNVHFKIEGRRVLVMP